MEHDRKQLCALRVGSLNAPNAHTRRQRAQDGSAGKVAPALRPRVGGSWRAECVGAPELRGAPGSLGASVFV